MPTFSVGYYTPEGTYRKRLIDAGTDDDANHIIRREGGHPVDCKVARRRNSASNIKLTAHEQIELFEHLELHLSSGIGSVQALDEIRSSASHKNVRIIVGEMYRVLSNAKTSLAEAFAMFPRSFPPAIVAVIVAAEGNGGPSLAAGCADLRDRLEYDEAKRAEVMRGLAYPAFLVSGAIGLVILMMTFFVPRVEALLKELDAPMPVITVRVIATANYMASHWPLLVSLFFIPFLVRLGRRIPGVALLLDKLFIASPYFGTIYRYLAVAQVAKYYNSIRAAGGQSGEILKLCEGLFANLAMRAAIARIHERVTTGKLPLWEACSREKIFPRAAISLIKTGEISGFIERAFASIEKFYSNSARTRINTTLNWLTPVVTVVTAVLVFTILFALFSPIFSIITNING